MVTDEELAARRAAIDASPDLQALRASLLERARPLLERPPYIPDEKALLSVDGGVCPRDRAALAFDPWSPRAHRCPRCGDVFTGERHDRHWARYQHLWLAERAAHLAALAALASSPAAGARAREILSGYGERYLRYPNRDNVLGPARLFFSTYLESVWLCNYLAAAMLLQQCGELDAATERAVAQVADEAANLIGEFDEWFSNRQTWNNAALTAIAVWFEDEALAERAVAGRTGLVAHLARGFGRDGMWYEGENYHLFALRALLTGAAWGRLAGLDLFAEAAPAARLAAALRAPAITALPDFTYPARKDSRFGVSLAQPAYLDVWERGLGYLDASGRGGDATELAGWLRALYGVQAAPELMESYLHDAPLDPRPAPHGRHSLSWLSFLEMLPVLPQPAAPWSPSSTLLDAQGLAVLRAPDCYVSLECGPLGGGHGHYDRLHLTVHAGGVHWLPDAGTASYVSPDLPWYRSTIAHNAPRWDNRSQPAGDATCDAFEQKGEWGWVRGKYGSASRATLCGRGYIVDVVDFAGAEEHAVELPWHFAAAVEVETPGKWKADAISDPFVSEVEAFTASGPGPIVCSAAAGDRRLRVLFLGGGELLRGSGPGRPGSARREQFFVRRAHARGVRFLTVLEVVAAAPMVRDVRLRGDVIEVETANGVDRHSLQAGGWTVEGPAGVTRLAGRRAPEAPFEPFIEVNAPTKARASALRVDSPPALDGTLTGFDAADPLTLDVEDQYRRSEEAYPGPEDISATAYANWDDSALYVAVDVTKPELCFRPPDAAPLLLDNEPDDIHSDGLQLYLGDGMQGEGYGFLVVPEGTSGGGLRIRTVAGTAAQRDMLRGAWRRTDTGYRVTVALTFPERVLAHPGGTLGFDLIVNEKLPDRMRRSGQLVWSGGNGWVWLRGDRQSSDRLGTLDLLG